MDRPRCAWLNPQLDLYREYHDHEWGVPSHDARHLFEMLCLEGAQAGLSWWTILRKRDGYRRCFKRFEPTRVAAMSDSELERCILDPGIVRHRGKVFAVRDNARAWLALCENDVDPVRWLWSFIGGKPRVNRWSSIKEIPATTPESDALSKALKKAGFKFVGSTTIYAFMQAVGMVNDHTVDCFRH